MVSKGKAKGKQKQAKGQSGGAWPTMADAVGAMDKQSPSMGSVPDRAPRAPKPKPIRISPKMPRLR